MTGEAVQCDDVVAESVNGATNRSSGTGLARLWREETLNHRSQPALAALRLDRLQITGQLHPNPYRQTSTSADC
jgi:hypothetical protein